MANLRAWTHPLLVACSQGDAKAALRILDKTPRALSVRDVAGWSALMLAARAKNDGLVAALLSRGADLDASPLDGHTPLMIAFDTRAIDTAQRLIEAGAQTESAIDRAAQTGDPLLFAALVDAGAALEFRHVGRFIFERLDALGQRPRLTEAGTPERDDRYGIYGYVHGSPDVVAIDGPLKMSALFGGCAALKKAALKHCHRKATHLTLWDADPHCERDLRIRFEVNAEATAIKGEHPRYIARKIEKPGLGKTLAAVLYDDNREPSSLHAAMCEAATSGHLDVLKCLLAAAGGIPDIESSEDPLRLAVYKDKRKAALHLIKHTAPSQAQLDGALSLAAYCDHQVLVRSLLKAGANPNPPRETPPLVNVASRGRIPPLRTLVEAGADINRASRKGETALMKAAKRSNGHKVVVWLLEQGANVHATDNKGRTALHWALRGHPKTMASLVQAGGDTEARSDKGETPLMEGARESLVKAKVLQALIDQGADLEARDSEGHTALHISTIKPRHKIAALLLKAGANASARDLEGRTALMMLTRYTNLHPLGKHLLEAGADVHAVDNEGRTALHWAMARNDFVACGLFDAGCRLDVPNKAGQTVADMLRAAPEAHETFIKWLEHRKHAW